jgi:hypothetical protein
MPPQVHVAEDEPAVWELVSQLSAPSSVFDAQGDAHGHIDGLLQDQIEAILVPILGPWEGSDSWFHNQDFYCNGVRSLLFSANAFPWSAVPALQACLSGDAAHFCIAIRLCDQLTTAHGRTVGVLVILQHHIVVSQVVSDLLVPILGSASAG